MKLKRIGNHEGYWYIVPGTEKPPKPAKERKVRTSRRKRIELWADLVWKQYGDLFGDWAVSGMTEEQRDRYIGGGSRKLDRLARACIHEGLSDAMQYMCVPDELFVKVRSVVLRISGM